MKFPAIFKKDLINIHHAAFWLAVFAVVSGVLGLFRDRLLAGIFGATRTLDIYYAAFRVPDFIYTIMLFLTSATAVIPLFLQSVEYGENKTEKFLRSLIFFFSFSITIFSLAAFFLMPFFSDFLFPGFDEPERKLSFELSRIMLLSPIFLGFSNIFSGILQAVKRFFAYALSPVFYNLGIIFGIVFLFPIFGLKGLAYGVVFGAFLNMAIQVPSLVGTGFSFRFGKIAFFEIKNLILNSMPRTLGLAVNQVSVVFFTAIASTLSVGSIAVFNLSQNLGYLMTTVVGLSYSVAAFPALASFSLKKDKTNFDEHFSSAFRHIIFWTVPFSALLIILRAQIVRVVLGSGAFSWQDTRLTAASLFLFSLAIVFQSLILLLVRSFYAGEEIKKPLFINIASTIFGIGLVLLFFKFFANTSAFFEVLSSILNISDISDVRVLILPLGIFTASVFNLSFLFLGFKSAFGWFPLKKSKKMILQTLLASFSGATATYFSLQIFSLIFNLNTFLGIFLQGLFSGISGIIVIFSTFYLLRNNEFTEILESFKNSIFKKPIIAPEPEKLP